MLFDNKTRELEHEQSCHFVWLCHAETSVTMPGQRTGEHSRYLMI